MRILHTTRLALLVLLACSAALIPSLTLTHSQAGRKGNHLIPAHEAVLNHSALEYYQEQNGKKKEETNLMKR